MEFAYFGYRDWAENIFKGLKEEGFAIDSFTVPNNEYVHIKKLGTEVLSRDDINNLNFGNYRALLFYGWSWMIPEDIVNGNESVCLHPSPLPKYRGGSPLQHQIIKGETKSAVTLFKMDKGMDTGPIYFQKKFSLEGRIIDVFDRITSVGTELTIKLLRDFEYGVAKTYTQNEDEATSYKRRKPGESELTADMIESMTSRQMHDFIRCLGDPYPNAYILGSDGKKVYLKDSDIDQN